MLSNFYLFCIKQKMDIQILQLIDGAKEARIDRYYRCFRAFSTACYAIWKSGAAQIIPVGNIEKAYRLKEQNPGFC
jgi:2-phosphosulfolactate phosphatase